MASNAPDRAANETASTHALEVLQITKRFREVLALDDVSFVVPRGSIFGLLGPNGAGKTTLFSIMAGFLHADSGQLRVLDTDIRHISQLRGRMTILPQDAAFQRSVPILEQLVFLRMLDGQFRAQAEQEVLETLALVGLEEHARHGIQRLSHGMLKRLGIAQAFLGSPELILLDEPTSGLDPQNAKQIRDLIHDLQRRRNITTLISSHNLFEIQGLCDHVAILDRGKLVASGNVDEITRQSRQVEFRLDRPLSDAESEMLCRVPGVGSLVDRGPNRYRLPLELEDGLDPDTVIRSTLQELINLGITPKLFLEGNSLEEAFLQLTGAEKADSSPNTLAAETLLAGEG